MTRSRLRLGCGLLAAAAMTACAPGRLASARMADALTQTAGTYASDDDPEFVRLAAPSTLKMIEMLLESQPRHEGLLLSACSGFTQYAYGFLQIDADLLPEQSPERSALHERASRMYERALGYCWRALDERHPGFRAAIKASPERAAEMLAAADVPAVYWLSVSWAAELALDARQLQRLEELAAVRVLLGRALALDEGWNGGAVHEAFISLDGMSVLLGGSAARARSHLEQAVRLSDGQSAFAYVTFASTVSVRAGDRAEFERLLRSALAVDVDRVPQRRMANLLAQKAARGLLAQADRLFAAR